MFGEVYIFKKILFVGFTRKLLGKIFKKVFYVFRNTQHVYFRKNAAYFLVVVAKAVNE